MPNTPTHTDNTPVREKLVTISRWLEDKKALDLIAFDLSRQAGIFDGAVILTATSLRHGQGLADFALEKSREAGFEFLRMEGYNVGQWILLDLNEVIVHIFQQDVRELFRLEDLWPKAPVVAGGRKETP